VNIEALTAYLNAPAEARALIEYLACKLAECQAIRDALAGDSTEHVPSSVKPEPPCGLNEQLRQAAELGQYVRVVTADGHVHKGVPEWDVSYWPHIPAGLNEHWIGEDLTNGDDHRVVSVEVI
jgi:hypothetical protein